MSSTEHKRATRVAERLRAELMDLLIRGEVRDPGAQQVFVSDVKVTDDLSQARVYLRLMQPGASAGRRSDAVRAMERASGFVRTRIAKKLSMKRVPELRFHWDDVVDHAERVEGLLAEVESEDARKES